MLPPRMGFKRSKTAFAVQVSLRATSRAFIHPRLPLLPMAITIRRESRDVGMSTSSYRRRQPSRARLVQIRTRSMSLGCSPACRRPVARCTSPIVRPTGTATSGDLSLPSGLRRFCRRCLISTLSRSGSLHLGIWYTASPVIARRFFAQADIKVFTCPSTARKVLVTSHDVTLGVMADSRGQATIG
jgi:hypothetical protein